MARGRAFVSDASGSGPHGGHGRGCSTHGRGGTIPPPSSSGTSGASSSTQPPVLPALPSVPPSSTPLPGPVESLPASLSPTAPALSEPRNQLNLVAGQMRKSGKKQQCVSQEIWESWQKAWEDPAFKRKGKKIWSWPTPMEVFTYTHTKDHDGNKFVNKCALGINLPHDHSAKEISALWAHVDEQERQLEELRAHVIRMSGQHGADTADDTLVTPADTMTHPADTPTYATTYDRVED
ncbi:hypothetical protein JCGZ_03267 [Jatropha curcas]|uniref:Uncharacterized protein n=1 Tax=Jatropha curcas TaxID=180498 RepID=A0A067L0R6_JATCU|nr:hypothetical protein JCGZ_03267 [Jatropha curcas]